MFFHIRHNVKCTSTTTGSIQKIIINDKYQVNESHTHSCVLDDLQHYNSPPPPPLRQPHPAAATSISTIDLIFLRILIRLCGVKSKPKKKVVLMIAFEEKKKEIKCWHDTRLYFQPIPWSPPPHRRMLPDDEFEPKYDTHFY